MSRTTACCHSRLASGPTRPLALRSTCTQPPKQCGAAVPLHRATVGRPPGLECSLISQCQICSLNSIAPLSYLPCECQRGSSCGFPHSLRLGHLAWLLPPGRGRRWPPPIVSLSKRSVFLYILTWAFLYVFIAALAGIKTCDAIQTALIKSST